ncbi:MAG: flagellin [Sphingomonadales bacterium]|nr:flagellin [Sphingomonadales bacterium]
MAFSVNTNGGALLALRSLNKSTSLLQTVQNRVSTGLKVASAKDNAAVFNIAQKLRSTVAGLGAVKASLDRGISATDVAVSAAEAVSDLLNELKAKAVAAKDPGLDTASRTALNDEFKELRDSITSIVDNAEFNGINAVKSDAIVAIVNDDASKVISISVQKLSLGSGNITITSGSTIETAAKASVVLAQIDASITKVGTALSKLGSGAKRIELQRNFIDSLSDSIEVGIGNLVDADLARESANLQALQVRQQLGLQALSIANQAPGAVLALFQ